MFRLRLQSFIRGCLVLIGLISINIGYGQSALSAIMPVSDDTIAGRGCGTDNLLKTARQVAAYRMKEAEMNREIANTPVILNDELTLPVVFHIIGEDQTLIPDQLIADALKNLNEAFSKTGAYALGDGVDTKIRFCMAKTGPDGGITNGVTRTTSFFGTDLNQSIEDNRLKNLVKWDPLHYINIYYVTNIHHENYALYGCNIVDGSQWRRIGTQGYATMPAAPLDSADGIVVSEFGPVLAHEMGHYLGLYHTFEGGCSNLDCTANGDRVCDTPPDNSYLPSSCTDPSNSCRTDTLSDYSNGYFRMDVPDQVSNFMDYGNTDCSNQFTNGQAVRMHATILALRKTLLQNKCAPPCADNIVAGFTRDINFPRPAETISFTNTSTGASNFQWFLNDSLVSSASNYAVAFADTGKYEISLKAYNNGNCFSFSTDYIIVTCGVTARFYTDKQKIASKEGIYTDSILFTNTSVNGSSFEWLVSKDDGLPEMKVSTSKNLVYTFPTPGNYYIRLVAKNAGCSDTTQLYKALVLDPTPDGRVNILSVDCYNQTKLRIQFNVCNNGYASMPPGTPVSFYNADPTKPGAKLIGTTFFLPDTIRGGGGGSCCSPIFMQIVDAKVAGLNTVFIAFNDMGKALPVKFPNTSFIEKNYANNIVSKTGFKYSLAVNPPNATLQPGDSVLLTAGALPETAISEYSWSPRKNLSCNKCSTTVLVADSTATYTAFSKSEYGCTDTALVNIKVPAVYDYTITIDKIACAGNNDSLDVSFSIADTFKRPLLPKGLSVAFYNANPITGIAVLLSPLFKLPANVTKNKASFNTTIKGMKQGTLYAVVNDNGATFPLKLPNTLLLETNYKNNLASIVYNSLKVTATNSGPVCEGDSVVLTANATEEDIQFKWTGPNGFTSTEQNLVLVNKSASASGTYSVIASNSTCSSIPSKTEVQFYAAPVVTTSSSSPVCETKQLSLNANSNSGGSYSWTGPNGFTSSSQNISINNVTAGASGTYKVTVTTSNNCKSSPTSVVVKVNPLPVPAFTAPDICLPSTTVTFKNQTTISEGNIRSWLWNFGNAASGDANVDSVKNPTHTYTSFGKYLVKLTAVSDAGCSVSTTSLYAGIHKQPVANFNVSPGNVCLNEPVKITDKSIGDDGTIKKWTWETGDGRPALIQNNISTTVDYTYTKEGVYTLRLSITNDNGCKNEAAKNIQVYALPIVNAGQDIYILDGNSTHLDANARGNVLSYTWSPSTYLNNTNINNPTVTRPLNDITYSLTVTSQEGCKASDEVLVKILRDFKIPNVFSPNGDGINDVWKINNLGDYPGAVVEIFDRYGSLAYRTIGYNNPWDGRRNGNPVPVGVYYYIITPKNGAEKVTGSVTVLR
ncbi:MAG: PKD domain-containing protein [Bacteroidota bacterium]